MTMISQLYTIHRLGTFLGQLNPSFDRTLSEGDE